VLLADGGFLIAIGLMLLGLVGFLGMAVVLILRLVRFVLRALVGQPAHPARATLEVDEGRVLCSHPSCRHANPPAARFCGRCGRRLARHKDVDAYG
jgi:uncharacterized paraquat-inducible protein A